MIKEEILTKMIHTVDNFKITKGEFEIYYDDILGDILIDYELSLNIKQVDNQFEKGVSGT
ncbi:hypothetical protein [Bacillus rhizoplanae]|uniref:hypothetical protein n=1 Tax=Bacillus rhizoplanae TaxID=2880966 RepID=UPI003D198476